jgi:hypothetical protein
MTYAMVSSKKCQHSLIWNLPLIMPLATSFLTSVPSFHSQQSNNQVFVFLSTRIYSTIYAYIISKKSQKLRTQIACSSLVIVLDGGCSKWLQSSGSRPLIMWLGDQMKRQCHNTVHPEGPVTKWGRYGLEKKANFFSTNSIGQDQSY